MGRSSDVEKLSGKLLDATKCSVKTTTCNFKPWQAWRGVWCLILDFILAKVLLFSDSSNDLRDTREVWGGIAVIQLIGYTLLAPPQYPPLAECWVPSTLVDFTGVRGFQHFAGNVPSCRFWEENLLAAMKCYLALWMHPLLNQLSDRSPGSLQGVEGSGCNSEKNDHVTCRMFYYLWCTKCWIETRWETDPDNDLNKEQERKQMEWLGKAKTRILLILW